jgi:hypothetical protein
MPTQPKRIEERSPEDLPVLAISPDKVCFIIIKAREFDVKDVQSQAHLIVCINANFGIMLTPLRLRQHLWLSHLQPRWADLGVWMRSHGEFWSFGKRALRGSISRT